MAISNKTRKILWGRSGNRCALCKCLLVEPEQAPDKASVIGMEAHIHAQNTNGPRFDPALSKDQIDDYDNLLLLCGNHHKVVDDQQSTFSAKVLYDIKRSHEEWVRDTLEPRKPKDPEQAYLIRILNGKELTNLINQARHAYDFDHDPLETKLEVDLVGDFLQTLQDWGDLWSDLDSADRVKAGFSLNEQIKNLEKAGFWVFIGKRSQVYFINNEISEWQIAVVRVIRQTNTEIITLDLRSSESSSPENVGEAPA